MKTEASTASTIADICIKMEDILHLLIPEKEFQYILQLTIKIS